MDVFFGCGLRHGDGGVREGRAPDAEKEVRAQRQQIAQADRGRHRFRRLELPALGALAVADVQTVRIEVAGGKRGAHG